LDICIAFPNNAELNGAVCKIFSTCFPVENAIESVTISFLSNGVIRKIVEGLSDESQQKSILHNNLFEIITTIKKSGSMNETLIENDAIWKGFWDILKNHNCVSLIYFNHDVYRDLRYLLHPQSTEPIQEEKFSTLRKDFYPKVTYKELLWMGPHNSEAAKKLCLILDKPQETIFSDSQEDYERIRKFFDNYVIDHRNLEYEVIVFARIFEEFKVPIIIYYYLVDFFLLITLENSPKS
jgi:hypothetical protein